jgi:hypothetical protein
MTKPLEKQILNNTENTGKSYIDPESTQIFIEALIKTEKENATVKSTSAELLEMAE